MNLDSSGWLEYFAGGPNTDFFAPAIEDSDNLLVSSINIYEDSSESCSNEVNMRHIKLLL